MKMHLGFFCSYFTIRRKLILQIFLRKIFIHKTVTTMRTIFFNAAIAFVIVSRKCKSISYISTFKGSTLTPPYNFVLQNKFSIRTSDTAKYFLARWSSVSIVEIEMKSCFADKNGFLQYVISLPIDNNVFINICIPLIRDHLDINPCSVAVG